MAAEPLLNLRVARIQAQAQDTISLDRVADDGRDLPPFEAGAHLELVLESPAGQVLRRAYSLCNAPGSTGCYQIAVLREPASRGGSAAVHRLQVGQRLQARAPRNLFALATQAPHHLLLAGGIGITPLLAMAAQLHAAGQNFSLHHAVRSLARAAFARQLAAAPYAHQVHWHADDGPVAQRLQLPALLAAAPAGAHLYVCGPAGLMAAALAAARGAGWQEARLHREYFGAEPRDTGSPDSTAPGTEPVSFAGDSAFRLTLARSGLELVVPAGQTVVQALAAAGVAVMTSCEQGICGTCLTRVLAGQPDHRDQYLSPEEQAAGDQFLPCCSRARSAHLTIDL